MSYSYFKFSTSIFTELVKSNQDANIIFSPLSILTVLSMILAGAKNNTLNEMRAAMHLNDNKLRNNFHVNFGKHIASLTNTSSAGVEINIANKLFLEKTYELVSAYNQLMREAYSTEIGHVDFISNSNGVRTEINKWVEDLTKQKIKDLLPDGSVDSLTRLVLVNAIYFKGLWKYKFKSQKTRETDFFTLDNQVHRVQMMYKRTKLRYTRNDKLDCSMLKLPFKNRNYKLVIILPNKRDGLPKLEKKLVGSRLRRLLKSRFIKQKCKLRMPKFKVESSFDLVPTLKALGMQDMFSPSAADFSGLSPGNDLFVSGVVHKAFLELDESGAESSAATAVLQNLKSRKRRQRMKKFFIDHPFLLAIVDKKSNPLFIGRIMKP